jgi:hypothetical protein
MLLFLVNVVGIAAGVKVKKYYSSFYISAIFFIK